MNTAPHPAPDPADQVVRLREFLAGHPEISVTPPHPITTGSWRAFRHGWLVSQQWQLSWLLDHLDELVTEPDDGWIFDAKVIPFPASRIVGDDGAAS